MKISKEKIEEVLTSIGYKKVGGIPDYYRVSEDHLIDVGKVDTVQDLCKVMFNAGSDYRCNLIKKAIQIN